MTEAWFRERRGSAIVVVPVRDSLWQHREPTDAAATELAVIPQEVTARPPTPPALEIAMTMIEGEMVNVRPAANHPRTVPDDSAVTTAPRLQEFRVVLADPMSCFDDGPGSDSMAAVLRDPNRDHAVAGLNPGIPLGEDDQAINQLPRAGRQRGEEHGEVIVNDDRSARGGGWPRPWICFCASHSCAVALQRHRQQG